MDPIEPRRNTVVISNLSPSVECGKYPAKRVVGELLRVETDIFKDGHDVLVAVVRWRRRRPSGKKGNWNEVPMHPVDNDRWSADLRFTKPGQFEFTVEAWADDYETWLHDFERRLTGDQENFDTELEEGRVILNEAALRAARRKSTTDAEAIDDLAAKLMKTGPADVPEQFGSEDARQLLARWPDRSLATQFKPHRRLVLETKRSQFSAWYEFFPRSAFGDENRPATLRDCLPRIDDAAAMGFDVVYFPPIHPIGETFRKGKNNSTKCEPGDVGSPWAIGSKHGGHRSVAPELGTVEDFKWLVDETRDRGLEIAMDFAIQCSPDHPWVRSHPEWFFHRPDGTIKYAENPPKKYQDIYPLNFHCDEWRELWAELLDCVKFWIENCGVTIFRVDNPHTKPVAFWEWLISEIHRDYPETIFLSEAFTRPKMMQALAKVGFTQSYTYFTWRVEKGEIIDYVNELTKGEMSDYYRANFWPNTPDILAYHLQNAPPAMFKIRAALAATLSSSWGMYSGYELCENEPLEGREEYLDSEKYQLKSRNWNKAGHIKAFITRLNEIRNAEPALQEYTNIEFLPAANDEILAFYKWSADDRSDAILVVVNLNAHETRDCEITVPDFLFAGSEDGRFAVEDLMYEEIYHWKGSRNYVSLDPRTKPVHILKPAQ
ncbi:MAG: alpha-1,4-glucan--maltose-1-phosphate maltosyltransferase [Verrucomicrobiales bacterium]|nr:alpha-1,4-glucan--maltose-1-phosphate maltosyltransferase [Verrucomicrobiales bacterium]